MILGIDEVGRGPWAGPLVVGAVVLPDSATIEGLTDSKKLTAKKRAVLDTEIKSIALGWGLGWVDAQEIDEVGLSAALRLATVQAVESIKTPYHEIIIDGTINFLSETIKGKFVTTLPKADLLVPAVSAASIIAKVARDTYMEEQDVQYPQYGFGSHVGYGTAKHAAALNEFGVTPLHRTSFAPIAKLIAANRQNSDLPEKPAKSSTNSKNLSTKQIGDIAENKVAQHFQELGYVIVERNWKTKVCEIDIVAEKGTVTYCIEVKYRSSQSQGGGVAAITPAKLKRMQFAAELYAQSHAGVKDIQLLVAEVDKEGAIKVLETL